MRPSLLLLGLVGGIAACGGDSIGGKTDLPNDTDTNDSAAQLVLSMDSVDFGTVEYGDVAILSVSVSNPGGTDLAITSLSVPSPFVVSPPTLQVYEGETQNISLTFQPTTYADFAVDLTMVTDSDDVGTVTLPVTGSTLSDVDGEDQDCDGGDDFDQDGDGYDAETDDHHPAEPDCIDTNADFHPGQTDVPYDGRDTNCDGANDYDADGDGSGSAAYNQGFDCDDDDPDVNRDGNEQLNGKDDDCDGEIDNASLAEYSEYVYDAGSSTDHAGYALALGDLDDDGDAETIVGSPYAGGSGSSAKGGVSVFLGGDPLMSTGTNVDDADNYFEGANNSGLFGSFVTVLGDFDGDGTNDLAIGEPGASSSTGNVYILGGYEAVHADQYDAMEKITGSGSSQLGRGLGTDYDLDGDGFADLVAMYVNGSSNYVAIEYGGASPSDNTLGAMDAKYSTDGTDAAFYRNAPVGGDFDGDGYDDLILSDSGADYGGYTDNGAVWALWGQSSKYLTTDAVDIETAATVLHSGSRSSSGAGMVSQLGEDMDGDGTADLWIADTDDALYVVSSGGSKSALPSDLDDAAIAKWDWGSSSPDASGLRRIGDWTGDGVDDMILYYDDGYGELSVFSTETASLSLHEWEDSIGFLTGSDDHGNANVGFGMAPVGADVDGDGDDDYAVGDPEYSSNKGEAYLLIFDPVE